jgi:hypothetical protein
MQPKNKKGQYIKQTFSNKVKYVFNVIIWKIEKWVKPS